MNSFAVRLSIRQQLCGLVIVPMVKLLMTASLILIEIFAYRASIERPENSTRSYLKIWNLTLEDEAVYRCEVTYHAVNRECNTVQLIALNVTGER